MTPEAGEKLLKAAQRYEQHALKLNYRTYPDGGPTKELIDAIREAEDLEMPKAFVEWWDSYTTAFPAKEAWPAGYGECWRAATSAREEP